MRSAAKETVGVAWGWCVFAWCLRWLMRFGAVALLRLVGEYTIVVLLRKAKRAPDSASLHAGGYAMGSVMLV